jgi:O-antigen/teichoic acid export membrane protein
MADVPEVRRRHWADVAAILAGLMLMGLAIWPVPFADAPETGRQVSVWWIYALAGGLSLVGVFLGQRWEFRQVARGLLFAAVGVLLYGLVTMFRDLGTAAVLTVLVPGLLLLLAAPFFGPMPRAAAGQ